MEIKWFGNTTFLIKNSTGKRILINPIDLNSSIVKYDFQPDLITLSTSLYNDDINIYLDNGCKLINSCESFANEYISIKGYNAYNDNIKGLKRGNNIIYIFEIDNIKFCHLGTLGHKLDNELLSNLKDLDFLFIPIGGNFCLDGFDAANMSIDINSKYILPMLYKSSLQLSYLDGPYKFISKMKNILNFNTDIIQTSDLSFDTTNSVIILTPKNVKTYS
ncbi:MAG: MBL fold metallo-hydrolase [Terrisporobacter sp.]|uniref:MBL fold metallo-hydrolase n=1 Tax=Clostridia TaxID=186801 RepID=UPI002FCA10B9